MLIAGRLALVHSCRLDTIAAVLWQNILPIFVVAGFGFALQRWQTIDKHTLSKTTLYVLSPALVFSSLVNSRLPGEELAGLAAFALLSMASMAALAVLTAVFLRLPRREMVMLLMVTTFVNSGNYGLTLVQLRYGDDGLSRAIVYFTTSTIVLYSVGIFLASMGELHWRQALGQTLRLPPLYAALGAILFYALRVPLPAPLLRATEVAGQGAIPVMLLVLGMQLGSMQGRPAWRLTVPAVVLRLLAAPLVAVLVARLLGLTGLGQATSVIEASMPTAVITIILATEFNLQPAAVTSIVVLTTLLSPFTLAATIALLGL